MITIDLSNDKKLDIIITKLDNLKKEINELKKAKSHKILEDNDCKLEFSSVIPKKSNLILRKKSTIEELNDKYFPDDSFKPEHKNVNIDDKFNKIEQLLVNKNNNIISYNNEDILNEIHKTSEEIIINEKQH